LTEYRTILRLAKSEGTTEAYRCKEELDFSYEGLAQKLRRGGNAEALFATKVVLSEGQADVAAVRTVLGKEGIDLDAASISVLDCGGVGNLPNYIKLLDALHLDLFVISDGDATKAAENPAVADRVNTIKEVARDRLFLFEEDIEQALGTSKQRDNVPHIVSLIEDLDIGALDGHHELRQLRDRMVGFVSQTEAPETAG
jgi:predicted ATP-dependent endonuclease of OLD family